MQCYFALIIRRRYTVTYLLNSFDFRARFERANKIQRCKSCDNSKTFPIIQCSRTGKAVYKRRQVIEKKDAYDPQFLLLIIIRT